MSLIHAFNPNKLPENVQKKNPLAIQREIILQYLLNIVTAFGILGLLFYVIRTRIDSTHIVILVPFAATILILAGITASRRLPYPLRTAALLLLLALESLAGVSSQGLSGTTLIYAIAFVAVMTVLVGPRSGIASLILYGLLAICYSWLVAIARIPAPPIINAGLTALISTWINQFLAYLLTGTSIAGAYIQLTSGLSKALNGQKLLADELQVDRDQLEVQVRMRTDELTRKTVLLEAARQVSLIIASESDTNLILRKAADTIRDKFKLSYLGIYLKEFPQENLQLAAFAGSDQRHNQPAFTGQDILSAVVSKGQPVLSEGQETGSGNSPSGVSFSALAVSIQRGEQTLGVLDLQSEQLNAFQPDEMEIFTSLADQLSIALEHARLIHELGQKLRSAELSMQETTQKDWAGHLKGGKRQYAYRFSQNQVDSHPLRPPESLQAVQSGHTVLSASSSLPPSSVLAVPIKLRNQTIGVLNLRLAGEKASPELVELVESAVSRIAVSLENARLLEDLQVRANRERLVGEISTKVRSATDIETILRTTAGELGRSLGVAEVVIQLNQLK